jgi:hypothetical protein
MVNHLTGSHVPVSSCHCEAAANWAALTYEVGGVEASVKPLADSELDLACAGWAVVIPDLNRIECVLDAGTDLRLATDRLGDLSEAGWSVWALVPLAQLNQAHDVFRSTAEYVQGWWEREDHFTFSSPEIP